MERRSLTPGYQCVHIETIRIIIHIPPNLLQMRLSPLPILGCSDEVVRYELVNDVLRREPVCTIGSAMDLNDRDFVFFEANFDSVPANS